MEAVRVPRPFVATAPQVLALFGGTLTQLRRPVFLPVQKENAWRDDGTCCKTAMCDTPCPHNVHYIEALDADGKPTENYMNIGNCPLGEAGGLVWVQEEWWWDSRDKDSEYRHIGYAATPEWFKQKSSAEMVRATASDSRAPHGEHLVTRAESEHNLSTHPCWSLQPADTMPRWSSRFVLEIMSVIVEWSKAAGLEWVCTVRDVERRELSDDELRALIEVPREIERYKFKHTITPRFVAAKLGDGKRWVEIMPIEFAPNYYVIRVDSAWDTEEGFVHDAPIRDHIDDIVDAIEDEYGSEYNDYVEEEFKDEHGNFYNPNEFPLVSLDMGVSWVTSPDEFVKRLDAAKRGLNEK